MGLVKINKANSNVIVIIIPKPHHESITTKLFVNSVWLIKAHPVLLSHTMPNQTGRLTI